MWSHQQKIPSPDVTTSDRFASSVAVDGDSIIVGRPDSLSFGIRFGAAFVYSRAGSTWTQQQKLTASDGAASDYFGGSVGISADTVVVGAPKTTQGANTIQGAAYVYVRSGVAWSEQAKLIASDGATGDFMGGSAAISGSTIVVGAPYGGASAQGAAYAYVRSGTVWSEQAKLTASGGGIASGYLGNSVAVAGTTAVVGAPNDAPSGGIRTGGGYVFSVGEPLPIVFVPGIAGSVLVDRADANAERWFPPCRFPH